MSENRSKLQRIETSDALITAAAEISEHPAIAVDLEADSMYHFQEKVCLIQLAAERRIFLIDPLQTENLEPLSSVFANPGICKVFHGADYDIRSLYRDFTFSVHNLFDTEIAARFLGLQETGLEALLLNRFGIQLDKKYQRKDWSRRPLPEEMLTYAADDVRYLLTLARDLEEELGTRGRLEWVREECERISRVRPAINNDQPLFMSFRGAGRLDSRSLAVLENLLQARRRIAEKKDRPLFKVFSNKSILALVQQKPPDRKQLEATGALSKKQIQMYAEELLARIESAMRIPPSELPVYPRNRAPSIPPAAPARIRRLKKWRDRKARELNIEPGVLLNKAAITAIALENPQTRRELATLTELRRWQVREFGTALVRQLQENTRS
ncbi:MAG TPA: ribonuclease D [Desulfobacterales bacterium]